MKPAFKKSLIIIFLGISLVGLIAVEVVAVNDTCLDPCNCECPCICDDWGNCEDCNGDYCNGPTDLEPLLLFLPLITSIVIIMFIFQRKSRSLIH